MLQWILAGFVIMLAVYGVVLACLALAGRGGRAREVMRFVPDCAVLASRLARDPRLPRSRRLLLVVLVGYLALPFDLVPDMIPVAGQLDDAIFVALVLRAVVRGAGASVVRELWPGTPAGLAAVLRLAGRS